MLYEGCVPSSIRTLRSLGESGSRERKVVALAARQHGVVTLDQLGAQGLSKSAVRGRVASGRLHRVHRGVYAVGRPDLPREGRWMAAVLACGPEACLSHASAAALHQLSTTSRAAIDVTVPRRARLSRPGIRVHRPTRFDHAHRVTVDAIPCTSVARTLLDLALTLGRPALERACDRAEILGLLDWSSVEELLERAEGRPGVRRLRDALLVGEAGAGVPRSELERRFLTLCRTARLPSPAINQWLAVEGEEMQVDFIWREERVVAETDGYSTHRTRQAFARDRRRDQLLARRDWRVVRFTWDQVTNDRAHVTAVLRDLLRTPRLPPHLHAGAPAHPRARGELRRDGGRNSPRAQM